MALLSHLTTVDTLQSTHTEETRMAELREKVLYSRETWEGEGNSQINWTTRFITRILCMVREELEESGDRDWLVDTEDRTVVKISEIEMVSR